MTSARFLHSRSLLNGVSDLTFLIIILATTTPLLVIVLYALYRAGWHFSHRFLQRQKINGSQSESEVEKQYPFAVNHSVSRPYSPFQFRKRQSSKSKPFALLLKSDVPLLKPAATAVHPLHPNHCNVAALIRPAPLQVQSASRLTHAQVGDILVGVYPGPPPLSAAVSSFPMLQSSYTFSVGLAPSVRMEVPRHAQNSGKKASTQRRPLMVTRENGSLSWEMPEKKRPLDKSGGKVAVWAAGKENAPIPF